MIEKKLHWKYYDYRQDTIILYQAFSEEYTYIDKIKFLITQLWHVICGSNYKINEIVIDSKEELEQLRWFSGEMESKDLLY